MARRGEAWRGEAWQITNKHNRMKYVSYSEKLRDPRWQKVRLEVMNRDNFTCRSCRDTETTLNVHHNFYEKGKNPWDYHMDDLTTLCEACHNRIEACLRVMRRNIGGKMRLAEKFFHLSQIENVPCGPYGMEWTFAQWVTDSIARVVMLGETLAVSDEDFQACFAIADDDVITWDLRRDEVVDELRQTAETIYRMIFAIQELEDPGERAINNSKAAAVGMFEGLRESITANKNQK